MNAERLTTVPNLLSLSRLPLAVPLCLAIDQKWWLAALILFSVAALTDWLDGWWARKFHQLSTMGRNLDPLTDKVLIGSALIFLQSAGVGVEPWMVAVVLGREIFITGLRGIIEATGAKFGADWFGKIKTVLQCATLFAIFLWQTLKIEALKWPAWILLYAVVIATLGSGVQYVVKAMRILGNQTTGNSVQPRDRQIEPSIE